ncbi:MAG: Na+/H+ antiporter subunit E [Oscillospiraceae bacterium]|nr:Na+/H+ antiporter subunit E [Oscillospiraceae bacterium]
MPFAIFIIWLIFSGRLTPEIIIFGIVISAGLSFVLIKYAGYSFKKELKLWRSFFVFIRFIGRLITDMFESAFKVTGFILSGKEIKPRMVTCHSPVKKLLPRMMLANSITLTPGTITVSADDEKCTVHCLDESFSTPMEDNCAAEKLLEKLEERL